MTDRRLQFPESQPPHDMYDWEGWASYCDGHPEAPPEVPTRAEWKRWTATQREAFDMARLVHYGRIGAFRTKTMRSVHDHLSRQCRMNMRAEAGARRGTIIDGLGGRGKTTIQTLFGRWFYRAAMAQFGPGGFQRREGGPRFIPVVNVLMPASATVKIFNERILRFFRHPISDRWRVEDTTVRVAGVLRQAQSGLVMVDELQFLNQQRQDHRDVTNHLKALANAIPVTFVYTCIGAERSGLLDEGIAGPDIYSQTRRRFSVKTIDAFPYDSRTAEQEWVGLLASFHTHLGLIALDVDHMAALAGYLHDRTQGVIGSLSQLLREGGELAISRGLETLTTPLLDEVDLDHDAEQQSRGRRDRHKPRE